MARIKTLWQNLFEDSDCTDISAMPMISSRHGIKYTLLVEDNQPVVLLEGTKQQLEFMLEEAGAMESFKLIEA